jgi:ribosomal protein S27AE
MRRPVAIPMRYVHERYLGRPSCPKCGELVMAPHASEYRSSEYRSADADIRHVWECDGCDYGFETRINLDCGLLQASC